MLTSKSLILKHLFALWAGKGLGQGGSRGSPEGSPPPLWLRHLKEQPLLTDQFRNLKRHLQSLKAAHGWKVFALAAPHRRAGVSTLVCNLGLLMSRDFLDQRILLVDTCQQHPALHLAFGLNLQPGLNDYLFDGLNLAQVSQGTFRANLEVVASGEATAEVASPYDLRRFQDFMEEARGHYDFVLVDCPPAFESSDAQAVGGQVDGLIVVAEANRLRYEVLQAYIKEMEKQVRIVGGVLNKREYVIPDFLYRFV